MQEADYGQTAMAFGGSNARHANDDHLLVRFYMHPAKDKAATVEEGRPIFKDVPYVHIMQPGNKESIIHRKATDMDKARFAEHYRKFEAREDQDVVSGTPLIEWPGVSRSQAEELKFFNVMSVEQLAGMSDTNTQNFRGMGELKRRAQAFLDISKDNAGAGALAAAEKRNEELEATIKELAARLGALEEDAPAATTKRRRKA
ncbi:hypothetical protein DRQ32_04205 [bacterium]|nr:MAG: hypothetical protein DRQ32_04205 [bacterium]